jgi:F0F1-type ATP synthase epsilon subunit
LAEEAREAMRRFPPGTPEEEFQKLIDSGLIVLTDKGVKVMANTVFGSDDDDEPETPPKKKRKRRKKPSP